MLMSPRWIIAVAVVAIGLGYLVLQANNWLNPVPDTPEVVQRRWAAVVAHGEATARSGGSADLLVQANNLRKQAGANGQGSDAHQQALDRLAEWWDHSGGLGEDQCLDAQPAERQLPALDLLELGRLALGSSEHIEPALALGQMLRERGSIVYGAVGFRIAEEALDQGVDSVLLQQYRPTTQQVLGVAARDSLCLLGLVDSATEQGQQQHALISRELELTRWYYGYRFERLGNPSQPRELLARLEHLVEQLHASDPEVMAQEEIMGQSLLFAHVGLWERARDMAAIAVAYESRL